MIKTQNNKVKREENENEKKQLYSNDSWNDWNGIFCPWHVHGPD